MEVRSCVISKPTNLCVSFSNCRLNVMALPPPSMICGRVKRIRPRVVLSCDENFSCFQDHQELLEDFSLL